MKAFIIKFWLDNWGGLVMGGILIVIVWSLKRLIAAVRINIESTRKVLENVVEIERMLKEDVHQEKSAPYKRSIVRMHQFQLETLKNSRDSLFTNISDINSNKMFYLIFGSTMYISTLMIEIKYPEMPQYLYCFSAMFVAGAFVMQFFSVRLYNKIILIEKQVEKISSGLSMNSFKEYKILHDKRNTKPQ